MKTKVTRVPKRNYSALNKRRRREQGVWKIAYADFMTAMMALFLVLWLISSLDTRDFEQMSQYFRTPLIAAVTGGEKVSASDSIIPGGGDDPMHVDGQEALKPPLDFSHRLNKQPLWQFKRRLLQLIQEDPVLSKLGSQLQVDMVPAGLRIQITDSKQRPMFELGSARIEPFMRKVLLNIAPIFNRLPNPVTVTGHTDNLPYASGGSLYSNWELSTERANAARRVLITGGMDPDKVIRVLGAAATLHLPGSASGAAINRRISILVLNHLAQSLFLNEWPKLKPAPAPSGLEDERGQVAYVEGFYRLNVH